MTKMGDKEITAVLLERVSDNALEELDSKLRKELVRRKRRVEWVGNGNQALMHIVAEELDKHPDKDCYFACSENNQLIVGRRMSNNQILFYQCVVVTCYESLENNEGKRSL